MNDKTKFVEVKGRRESSTISKNRSPESLKERIFWIIQPNPVSLPQGLRLDFLMNCQRFTKEKFP